MRSVYKSCDKKQGEKNLLLIISSLEDKTGHCPAFQPSYLFWRM